MDGAGARAAVADDRIAAPMQTVPASPITYTRHTVYHSHATHTARLAALGHIPAPEVIRNPFMLLRLNAESRVTSVHPRGVRHSGSVDWQSL